MSVVLRKKGGDFLCDIGKYLVTAVPLTYILSEKFDSYFIVIVTSLAGVILILFGLYFIRKSETEPVRKGKIKKIRLLKNSVYTVEEL